MSATKPTTCRRHRLAALGAILLFTATSLTGCLFGSGDTSQIEFVATRTKTVGSEVWQFDYYRNLAYPCSISGYATFVISHRQSQDPNTTAPLWVRMHGGGVGYFAPDHKLVGLKNNMQEESFDRLQPNMTANNLQGRIARQLPEFRHLNVSMCNQDLYGGTGQTDPNNPNLQNGQPARTWGLLATKAAIKFTVDHYSTDDFFLHGGSAGSAGTYNVALGLQYADMPAAGIIADSGNVNLAFEQEQETMPGSTCSHPPEGTSIIAQRVDPTLASPDNQPHLLISRGDLKTPVAQVYNVGDYNMCAYTPMECQLPDGTVQVLGSVVCNYRPVRMAIQAQGPSSRSISLELCVDDQDPLTTGNVCDKHVPTDLNKPSVLNTQPGVPADFNQVLIDWVQQRRADN